MPCLDQIPDEIIHHILTFVSPEDNLLRVQLFSRRLNALANDPILWRQHCRTSFAHWDPRHDLPAKLDADVASVDWKALFLLRKARNVHISNLFDGILSTKLGRVRKFEQICRLGYDAKDFLLEQCRTIDSADDVLARRYHSKSILASLRRGLALDVWRDLRNGPAVDARDGLPAQYPPRTLERALGALDMFIIDSDEGDLDHISSLLDDLTAQFSACHANLEDMNIRDKALALNRWLRAHNLTGLENPETEYRNLKNCFIGHALRDPEHPSLPLISAAIFCCVAERLGLTAQCLPIPGHVHVVVFATRESTLDGARVMDSTQPVEQMYLDPFSSAHEVTKEAVLGVVFGIGWQASLDSLLTPASPAMLVLRMTANIKASFTSTRGAMIASNEVTTGLPGRNTAENLELAVYGAAWASLLLAREMSELLENSRQLAFWFRPHQSEDAWLLDTHFSPLCREILGSDGLGMTEFMPQEPDQPLQRRVRTSDVVFRVGQLVRHIRFGNIAVIIGWTYFGSGIFYTCMMDRGPRNIVAKADNLELVTDLDPETVTSAWFERAGLYFKRFDRSTCSFVSNIREEYPDD
ncbi:F-box domain-containing protein [Sodiomyces alkalinus F11]|uniref:F-box domain-containing protein n=1 Tax=Sodiomyces alkalinus (strain CBS 110278 / VKM F-3762 / F11) TaxID=1314773 RepID=A0A3N2Q7X1_SODAK|nr:F-box domain-containing protein [Sodiomyces alkalinus F11]ROT42735.1 F-box domain-containing protein [Sodiomyces alkalinus F11]